MTPQRQEPPVSNGVLSLIRTYVPIVVGALASWLLTLGVEVDAEAQAGLVVAMTGVLQAIYYAAARWAETRWPWLGVLLGSRAKPTYTEKG
ncbi:MAG TPA: hypothetical protein VK053_14280 [Jiangellaceae bacterium]|nr:hypothetical protein [Jiangellaceae bacterium]